MCNDFYNFFAGWSVFFGRRAAFCHHFRSQFWASFLVPVLGTRLPPDTRIINEPCICDPILGTRSGPQNGTPKPHNFLPRNPDTFQPNFEKNLTKKPKKLETRKRYCKHPEKTRTRAPNWQHKQAILTARKRNTHPLALWCNHHGEA